MKKILLFLQLTLLLGGCTARYLPLPQDDVIISEYFGIVNQAEYQFAAESRYWSREPSELASYFSTFYVVIRNRAEADLSVELADFALIDANGNQYDPISNEYLERLIEPTQLDYFLESDDGGSHFFDLEDELMEQKSTLEKWQQARENLIKYSFRFGQLRGGARKAGFIFFPKLEESNQNCSLIFGDSKIEFSKIRPQD
jgi:hypothetical protein